MARTSPWRRVEALQAPARAATGASAERETDAGGPQYLGYGDVGVVYVYKLIWDDKVHNKNDFDEWFNSLDFSPICEDKDDGDWEDGCELHILVKDLFKFVFEHDIRFIELM